jgi:hypothetical protein
MFRKIKLFVLGVRLKFLACRIKRRDRRSRWHEFRTGTLVRKYYLLNSIRKDIKKYGK